ncbi:thyroid adenoma-associated protein-like protein [Elysia marginata]|uniref:Thyroid adenoma-associated protein-like protein n=1 Tax=Elysia marginata TaxID=1093978 RepID=A0AAV4I5T1_9GAST|nr:thyroid adenoma-associated protein-like protein [Elysia marginata]
MSLDKVLTLFEEVAHYRPGDVLRLVKKLEQQCQALKGQDLSTLNQRELDSVSRQGSKAYFRALTSARLARATHKVIKCFPKHCEDELRKELVLQVESLLTSTDVSNFKTLSLLLDQNQDAKSLAKANSGRMSKFLHAALCTDMSSLFEQNVGEKMHCGVKLCIQTLQLCKTNVQQLLEAWSANTTEGQTPSIPDENYNYWKEITLVLVSHLLQNFSGDYLLLVGTALAMVLNCAPSPELVAASFMDIIPLLAQEKSSFEFCGIHYCQEAAGKKNIFLPVIAVIKGLLVSCNKNALQAGTHPLVFQVFPHVLKFCKGPTSQHYLSFQVLALWCQKVQELGALRPSAGCLQSVALLVGNENSINSFSKPDHPRERAEEIMTAKQRLSKNLKSQEDSEIMNISEESSKSSDICYMSTECPVLSSILDCIWLNWDSPVEGVTEYVLEIFRRVLNIWCSCVLDGTSSYSSLCEELFERVTSMAWYSKTRYKPLSLLLPHVDCEKAIAHNPRLKDELFLCMKTNHLASVASDIYKAFLNQLMVKSKTKDIALAGWETIWMPVLISGLSSEHLQLQCEDLIRAALSSDDDLIKAEAFHLLASTLKKSESLSDLELELLREFIPFNLRTDSASFRHNLSSSVRKVLVRVRDSCLACVKIQSLDASVLKQGLAFVDWLYELLMLSLAPGSSYQRRQTTFDLLFVLLESLMYQEESTARKGKAQESVDILVKYAQKNGMWNFFSSSNFLILLYCLEDGAEEIQRESYKLLITYFKWPSKIDYDTSIQETDLSSGDSQHLVSQSSFAQQIMDRAFHLISRPRAYENHTLEHLVSLEEDRSEETTTLSPEFQLLLSWCWINLKGAIEGCRSGLYQFSLALMSSGVEELVNIARNILQKVLASLSGNCLTSSVTRRSAGLPIIVQTILQAACKCGDFVLLASVVEELYCFAAEPLPETHSQQHDLRQSHALNILKAIFCDASLAPRLMPLLSKVVILVIEGFDSASWAIRNAATQLISTLVTRIFGQRSKTDSAGSMNLEEFAALYPDVLSFLCSRLNAYVTSGETLVRPSLYVMLTILANIGPLPRHQFSNSSRSFLQRAAEFFLGSPVLSLRKLAAQVWVSLSALDEADSTLQEILHNVVKIRNNLNLLHGWVFCAHYVFANGCKSSTTSLVLINFCLANKWLISGCSSCMLISSLVMNTIQLAISHVGEIKQLLNELWTLTENYLASTRTNREPLQVAKRQCLRDCIKVLHTQCQTAKDPDFEKKFQSVLGQGLTSDDLELQAESLQCLYEGLKSNTLMIRENMQNLLWENMRHGGHYSNFIKAVEILLLLRLNNQLNQELAGIERMEKMLAELQAKETLCLRKTAFDLEGILIGFSGDERLLKHIRDIAAWCQQQVQFSCPTANEILRLSAASSLRTCGARLLDFCNAYKGHELVGVFLVNIVKTVLTLLEDTEDEVRQQASIFISDLCNQAKMHYSIAYSLFSELTAKSFFWCDGLHSTLLEILYKEGSIREAVTSASASEPGVLFEAETRSAMSEEHVSLIWAFVTLKRIVLKYPEVCCEKLKKLASVALKELSLMMPLISENLNGRLIFNMSVEESVLNAVLGIILLSDLCHSLPESMVETRNTSLRTFVISVSKLHEVQNLHPFLHKKYYGSDKLLVCNLLDSKAVLQGTS